MFMDGRILNVARIGFGIIKRVRINGINWEKERIL
jgi:hypothetical protein